MEKNVRPRASALVDGLTENFNIFQRSRNME